MQRKERIKVMKAWSESGLTKVAFCETKDINYGTFLSWFQQEKVLAATEASKNEGLGDFISLGDISKVENRSIKDAIEILLPNGVRLSWQGKMDLSTLKMLANV